METGTGNSKLCGFCGEEIGIDLRRCPYCGSLAGKSDNININSNMEKENVVSDAAGPDNGFEQLTMDGLNTADDTNKNSDGINNIKSVDSRPLENSEYNRMPQNMYNAYSVTNTSKPLSNGFKVFIVTLCNIIPGFGQVAGLIIAVVLMNSEDNEDKRSFGTALMVSSLIVFAVSIFTCFVLGMAFSMLRGY